MMKTERIDAIKTIIGQIDTLSDAVNIHLDAVCEETSDQENEDLTQRLEFAFAELRAARHELVEVTKYALTHA